MKKIVLFLGLMLMSFGVIFAADQPNASAPVQEIYIYDLLDEGGFQNSCSGIRVSPQLPCDDKWYTTDTANGDMTYTWTANGEITVQGSLCNDIGVCRQINDVFDVLKNSNNKVAWVIKDGENYEVLLNYNVHNSKMNFGSEKLGYIVKGKGDAPDWVKSAFK